MVFSIFAVILTLVCWRSGKWRNWKEYYSTVLYLFIGNIVCDLLVYQKPLWAFNDLAVRYPFLCISITAVLYPSTVIMYLSHLPKTAKKCIFYIVLWAAIYSAMELLAHLIGDFRYFNGWHIIHSLVFNVVMFPMILLHYKKPLFAWPISAVLAFLFIWFFEIPLAR